MQENLDRIKHEKVLCHCKMIWHNKEQNKTEIISLVRVKELIHFCECQTWNIPRVSDVIKGMGMIYWCLQVDVVLYSFTKSSQMSYFKPFLDIWFCEWLLNIQIDCFSTYCWRVHLCLWSLMWFIYLSAILSLCSSPKPLCRSNVHPCCLGLNLCSAAGLRRPWGPRRGIHQEP